MARSGIWRCGGSLWYAVLCLLVAALALLSGPRPAAAQPGTPEPHPSAAPGGMSFMPTDRFARPTLPASPTQADLGSQVYWLRCMVCHGDRGQGLTDEFRAIWPPQDQNCWQAKCHGSSRTEGSFVIPRTIPAVVGAEVVARFKTAADLHQFIASTMPYYAPGSLEADQYWQVTAYLARANGADPGRAVLSDQTAASFGLQPAARSSPSLPLLVAIAAVVAALAGLWLVRLRRRAAGR